jgi:hypothetical protein
VSPLHWPWGLIGRIAGGVVVALCVAWLVVVVKSWHADAQALPAAEARAERAEAYHAAYRESMRAEVARIATVSRGYQDELRALRITSAARPARVVRLCREPAGVGRQAGAAAGPVADGAAAGAGELSQEAGRDLGPGPDIGAELYGLIDEADRIVAQCRALQDYVSGLPVE